VYLAPSVYEALQKLSRYERILQGETEGDETGTKISTEKTVARVQIIEPLSERLAKAQAEQQEATLINHNNTAKAGFNENGVNGRDVAAYTNSKLNSVKGRELLVSSVNAKAVCPTNGSRNEQIKAGQPTEDKGKVGAVSTYSHSDDQKHKERLQIKNNSAIIQQKGKRPCTFKELQVAASSAESVIKHNDVSMRNMKRRRIDNQKNERYILCILVYFSKPFSRTFFSLYSLHEKEKSSRSTVPVTKKKKGPRTSTQSVHIDKETLAYFGLDSDIESGY
jgi:hypothetical protein